MLMPGSEDVMEQRSGVLHPVSDSPLQYTLRDSSPSIHADDTIVKTVEGHKYSAALSEGTLTDSTPGSGINHTPSLEEGTILSSVSSYRSIAERQPGLWRHGTMSMANGINTCA